jgi:phage terminase Nu1 subunit (DNA packaging protein)
MARLVTLSELARALKVSKSYVHKLKQKGVLLFDARGLIDEALAQEAIAASRDPSKAYMAGVNQRQHERDDNASNEAASKESASGISFMKAKTMREAFNAKIAQLDYQERRGELIEAEGVNKTITDAAAIIRAAMERIPDKLASRVAAEPDAQRCHALLTGEVDSVLQELTSLCDRIAQQGRL